MAEYKAAKDYADPFPPKAVDVLAGVFEGYRKHSGIIPPRPYDAAHWWIDHQEPPNEGTERMERVTNKDGKVSWRAPYIDRLTSTLRAFLALNETHRIFIIGKIQQGIPWRGDDMEMFKLICDEEERMSKDKLEYIRKASSIFQNFKTGAYHL